MKSVTNQILSQIRPPEPTVGSGGTVCYLSDRQAVTVTAVKGRAVTVQRDRAVRSDQNGMSDTQSYVYSADPKGHTQTFTVRKDGRYVAQGDSLQSGAVLVLGTRCEYHDYSF